MAHDFKRFPELTNNQMDIYYLESPHKQITDDFIGKVVKVTDGDTIRVTHPERDFDFPVRFQGLAAPELKERGGPESQRWLASQILGKEVDIILTEKRVEKWGRLLADVVHHGLNMSEESIDQGHAIPFADRTQVVFPTLDQLIA